MKIELIQSNYGKSKVRVTKVKRDGEHHEMKESLFVILSQVVAE